MQLIFGYSPLQIQSSEAQDWSPPPPSGNGTGVGLVDAAADASAFASGGSSITHAENLATAMYALSHLQQLGDPVVFLVAEFLFK